MKLSRLSTLLSISALVASLTAHTSGQQQQEDTLLRAMREELARSVAQLKLEKLEKPYYIEYAVVDEETFHVKASFGALVSSRFGRSRPLRIDLRVGGYDFDNSEFFSARSLFSRFGSMTELVEDDNYDALRRDLWLASDTAYKQALEQLARKRASVQNKVQAEQIPDFSRAPAATLIAPRREVRCDHVKCGEIVRRLSVIFRDFPAIQDSSVELSVRAGQKYFVSSEGTVYSQPTSLVVLNARATTQAADGMVLKHFVSFLADSLGEAPGETVMAAGIKRMAQELTQLAGAPVLDNYSGPVLVTGQAATELFAQLLAPEMSGHRPPLFEQPQMAAMFPQSDLADRLNRPVLPNFLNVVDDPTQASFNNQPLIGAYAADDQGVPARQVTLVQRGVLKALLMSRRPRKEVAESNGHGRSSTTGSATAQIGNLFIQSIAGKRFAELKQELINLCKAQGLSYGLIIKVLDNPSVTGIDISSMVTMPNAFGRVSTPLLVYRVSVKDGREELVRGIVISEISVRTLRDIAAAGTDYYVGNRLSASGEMMGLGFSFGFGMGEGGAGAIPTSVIAPSILFEELELKSVGVQQKPALLPHPFFNK